MYFGLRMIFRQAGNHSSQKKGKTCCRLFKLKTLLKRSLTKAKFSNPLLKLIFLAKVRETWIHDYWNENTPDGIFHFFVSVIELEFQPIGFLITFIRKLIKMFILNLFSNIGRFNRKMKNAVRFSIIKIRISVNFMYLRSKLTSDICQKQSKTV